MNRKPDGLKKDHNPVMVDNADYKGFSKIVYEYYDRNGELLDNENGSFAKTAAIGDSINYFAMSDMNGIVDVDGILKRNKFKKVNYDTFNNYLKYLTTKNKRFLVSARRSSHG